MTSNIHVSWDGHFTDRERLELRQILSRTIMEGELRMCDCGIALFLVSRGDRPAAFSAHLACGCGLQSEDRVIALPAKV